LLRPEIVSVSAWSRQAGRRLGGGSGTRDLISGRRRRYETRPTGNSHQVKLHVAVGAVTGIHYYLTRPRKDASLAAKEPDIWYSSARMCFVVQARQDGVPNAVDPRRSNLASQRDTARPALPDERKRRSQEHAKTTARLGQPPGPLHLSAHHSDRSITPSVAASGVLPSSNEMRFPIARAMSKPCFASPPPAVRDRPGPSPRWAIYSNLARCHRAGR
jgi:hypothetical protein